MTCATCRKPIPPDMLACPACVEERGRVAVRLYQRHPVAEVMRGNGSFRTRTIRGVRHIEIFHYAETFCGLSVEPHHRRGFASGRDVKAELTAAARAFCPECVAAVKRIEVEAKCSA